MRRGKKMSVIFGDFFTNLQNLTPEEWQVKEQEAIKVEAEARKRERYSALLGSGIDKDMAECRFDNYDTTVSKSASLTLGEVLSFEQSLETKQFSSLILYGNPGSGKTHLLTALVYDVVNWQVADYGGGAIEYKKALYTKSDSLVNALSETKNFRSSTTYDSVLERYSKPDLLVIDEVGRNGLLGQNEANALFAVIDKRKSLMRPVAIGTNCSWNELYALLGSAVMSRLMAKCFSHDLSDIPDYRLRGKV